MGTGRASGGKRVSRPSGAKIIGEVLCQNSDFLLLIAVAGRTLACLLPDGHDLFALTNTRAAGAGDNGPTLGAETLKQCINRRFDLFTGGDGQRQIAALIACQRLGNCHQLCCHRCGISGFAGHPVAKLKTLLPGKQCLGHWGSTYSQSINKTQMGQIDLHGSMTFTCTRNCSSGNSNAAGAVCRQCQRGWRLPTLTPSSLCSS